jgi:hypothetical protein
LQNGAAALRSVKGYENERQVMYRSSLGLEGRSSQRPVSRKRLPSKVRYLPVPSSGAGERMGAQLQAGSLGYTAARLLDGQSTRLC